MPTNSADEIPRYYWDACNFISMVNPNEKERGRVCDQILIEAKNKKIKIATSALTIVEFSKVKGDSLDSEQEEKLIASFFEGEWIDIYDLELNTANLAHKLVRKYHFGARDAIHLATAVISKSKKFQTWDEKHFRPGTTLEGIEIEKPQSIGGPLLRKIPPL